jgi:hypothetical protein
MSAFSTNLFRLLMTLHECRTVGEGLAQYQPDSLGSILQQDPPDRASWLACGHPFAVLAALRNDLELKRLPDGSIYTIHGFLRAKIDVLTALQMNSWRFAAILAISTREMSRRFLALADKMEQDERPLQP